MINKLFWLILEAFNGMNYFIFRNDIEHKIGFITEHLEGLFMLHAKLRTVRLSRPPVVIKYLKKERDNSTG